MFTLYIDPDVDVDGTNTFLRLEFPYSATGDGFESDLGTGLDNGAEIDCISTAVTLTCKLYHSTNKPYIWIVPGATLSNGTTYTIRIPGIKNPSKPTSSRDDKIDMRINLQIITVDSDRYRVIDY